MNPIYFCLVATLCCGLALQSVVVGSSEANEKQPQLEDDTQAAVAPPLARKDVSEEMQLINKSLEGLMNELAAIKREATGRLSQVRKGAMPASQSDLERIRQQKVSRFVLKRVAELESESLGMRDEMAKLFELSKKTSEELRPKSLAQARHQEDHDFDEPATSADTKPSATTQNGLSSAPAATTTTTMKPEEEAAQIGFDLEQLKKLGEEIGKRLDQFGKEAAKNLGELMEGIKLVFREPAKGGRDGNELESEIESRQAQNPQSLRGIHEQIIRMTDQMVQNYLGSVRRVVHRFNNLFDRFGNGQSPTRSQPRESPISEAVSSSSSAANSGNVVGPLGESVVGQLQDLSKRFREFTLAWSRAVGKQQSPLIDRIPPRGVELWRDFWDTVRKQIRRINNEFLQVTRDMGRMLTGRRPSHPDGTIVIVRPREDENGNDEAAATSGTQADQTLGSLLYATLATVSREQAIEQQFHEFYEKLTAQLKAEQQKMDAIGKASGQDQQAADEKQVNDLIEDLDDEQTRQALTQNPGLRQQINQDINVFSSIFDIIRTFLTRLRGSAEDIRNILERPGAMRDNNSVTPGPAVKPTVDQLLKDTIDSQRNINSQAKPSG